MALALTVKPNTEEHVILTTESGEKITVFVRSKRNEAPVSLAITAPRSIVINRSKIQQKIDSAQKHQ